MPPGEQLARLVMDVLGHAAELRVIVFSDQRDAHAVFSLPFGLG